MHELGTRPHHVVRFSVSCAYVAAVALVRTVLVGIKCLTSARIHRLGTKQATNIQWFTVFVRGRSPGAADIQYERLLNSIPTFANPPFDAGFYVVKRHEMLSLSRCFEREERLPR